MLRRQFMGSVAALGAVVALPGAGLAASSQDPRKFSFMVPANNLLSFAPVLFASASGLYLKAGLDLKVENGRGAGQVVQLVVAKKVNAGRTGGGNYMIARANNKAPALAFATIAQRSPFVIVSAEQAPLSTVGDLAGKTIGMQSMGGSMEATLDLMLVREGVEPKQVTRQRVADSAASYGMVEAGRVDGFMASTSAAVKLREQGFPIETLDIDDGIPGQVYVAQESDLADNKDAYVAFLKATLTSVRELLSMDAAQLREAAEQMRGKFDIPGAADLDVAAADLKANRELWRTADDSQLLRCIDAHWAAAETALRGAGRITGNSTEPMYTDEIWLAATAAT